MQTDIGVLRLQRAQPIRKRFICVWICSVCLKSTNGSQHHTESILPQQLHKSGDTTWIVLYDSFEQQNH